jgi:hypothetical protein
MKPSRPALATMRLHESGRGGCSGGRACGQGVPCWWGGHAGSHACKQAGVAAQALPDMSGGHTTRGPPVQMPVTGPSCAVTPWLPSSSWGAGMPGADCLMACCMTCRRGSEAREQLSTGAGADRPALQATL